MVFEVFFEANTHQKIDEESVDFVEYIDNILLFRLWVDQFICPNYEVLRVEKQAKQSTILVSIGPKVSYFISA